MEEFDDFVIGPQCEDYYNEELWEDDGVQRSLVAHLIWVQRVAGPSPVTPTNYVTLVQEDEHAGLPLARRIRSSRIRSNL